MSNYEQLRSEINKRFPERLKLEFGCEVQFYGVGNYGMILHGLSENSFICFDDSIKRTREEMHKDYFKTIFGKPLELPDVLRVLPYEYAISHDGTLWKNQEDDVFGGDSLTEITEFNLAVPLSHPDNSEACEKLLALLTNK